MDGMRFVATFHAHSTPSADAYFRYKLTCDATLVQVDTNGTANVTSSMTVGTAADDDGYTTWPPGRKMLGPMQYPTYTTRRITPWTA
jgi:hypothetical protein